MLKPIDVFGNRTIHVTMLNFSGPSLRVRCMVSDNIIDRIPEIRSPLLICITDQGF